MTVQKKDKNQQYAPYNELRISKERVIKIYPFLSTLVKQIYETRVKEYWDIESKKSCIVKLAGFFIEILVTTIPD